MVWIIVSWKLIILEHVNYDHPLVSKLQSLTITEVNQFCNFVEKYIFRSENTTSAWKDRWEDV